MSGKEYGIPELAKALGIEEASVRVRLRKEKVKKAGKSYTWNKGEFDKLTARFKTEKKPVKKVAKKPAKKSPAKKQADHEPLAA